MKTYVKMMLVAAVIISFGSLAFVYAEANKGADQITLKGGSRGEVPFPHHIHQENLKGDCNVCHQDFPQESGAIERLKTEGKLKPKQVMNSHCVKCHREMKNEGKKSGPTSCSKCHVK